MIVVRYRYSVLLLTHCSITKITDMNNSLLNFNLSGYYNFCALYNIYVIANANGAARISACEDRGVTDKARYQLIRRFAARQYRGHIRRSLITHNLKKRVYSR